MGTCLQVCLYSDSNFSEDAVKQWEISLDTEINQLAVTSQGCFITTQASLYYLPLDTNTAKFDFFTQTPLPIITFPTDNLVASVEPAGNWFVASYIPRKSKTPIWEIWQLKNCELKRSQINRRPWNYLFGLNRRYGLGIYGNQQQQTEFHLFNRRGNWLDNFTLEIQLEKVAYHPQFPQRLLVTELNNFHEIITIELERLKVKRIPIATVPQLITLCPQGYLISDRQNNLTLIDGEDNTQKSWQIPLGIESGVTAIASNDTHIIIATTSCSKSQLHKFLLGA